MGSPPRHPRDLLSGWKEISTYLCLSPYRVRSLGYPVRKLPGRAGMGRVWAVGERAEGQQQRPPEGGLSEGWEGYMVIGFMGKIGHATIVGVPVMSPCPASNPSTEISSSRCSQ